MASTMFVTASALFVLCVRVVRDLTVGHKPPPRGHKPPIVI